MIEPKKAHYLYEYYEYKNTLVNSLIGEFFHRRTISSRSNPLNRRTTFSPRSFPFFFRRRFHPHRNSGRALFAAFRKATRDRAGGGKNFWKTFIKPTTFHHGSANFRIKKTSIGNPISRFAPPPLYQSDSTIAFAILRGAPTTRAA